MRLIRCARGLGCCLGCALLILLGCATDHVLDNRDSGVHRDGGGGGPCATRCDDVCVDLATDPINCGACGRTCVVSGAEAACVAGECAVGACEAGRLDCNASAADGCETPDACTAGGACTTACGSAGTLDCADRCAPACRPAAESCNSSDDDCNGACDDGAGCRRPVHRALVAGRHFYTTDRGEAERAGTVEAYDFFWIYTADTGGMSSLFRCLEGDGAHLYTTDTGCEMRAFEGTMGFVYRTGTERCGAIPLFRLHLAASNDHFYTTSAAERDYAVSLGYVDRGVVAFVWPGP